jgi:hypothetical protein
MVNAHESPEEAVLDALSELGAQDDVRPATPEPVGEQPRETEGTTVPEKVSEPRTFSLEEVGKIESAKDREIAELRRHINEGDRQRQLEAQANEEARRRAEDERAADVGEISQDEVSHRQRMREEQAELDNRRAVYTRLDEEANRVGKTVLAHDLAVIYGVDAAALANDETLLNENDMRAAARGLQQDKRDADYEATLAAEKGREVYDAGQIRAGGSPVFDALSPEDKIGNALASS